MYIVSRKVVYEKEKIVEKAFKLLKKEGMEAITARKLGAYMKTSPAPIYHSFESMDELKLVLVQKAKELFLEYINKDRTGIHFLNIGLGFCIFAREERNLFKNIFLNSNVEKNILEQFVELTQSEINRDPRFLGVDEEVKSALIFDSWTYAQGLATFVALGHLKATDEQLTKLLMRCPAKMIYNTLGVKPQEVRG